MNCKNVEPLLSLYVGRDLDEERLRLVAAHLQSCSECTLAADEFAGASRLLQRYEPPLFSDEIYAGIRAQVLNEIKRESHAPVWPGIFSWFVLVLVQPRMRWITAALLLAISVTALYLSRNPSHQLPNQVTVQAGKGTDVRSETAISSPSKKEPITRRSVIPRKKANAVVVATNRSRQLDKTAKADVSQPSSPHAPLRVEMQTSDRNIRIIWLSGQRPPAGGRDGSKGL